MFKKIKQDWSEQEKKQLLKLRDKGLGWLEIANQMGRTPDSIRMWYRNNVSNTTTTQSEPIKAQDIPRVALFDVETLPAEVYVYGFYNENIGVEQVISGSSLLSWSGKFLNEAKVYSDILTSDEAIAKDDERLTKSCWDFLMQCDVVVGHNLIDFDSKVVNTRVLKHNLPPIKKYVKVDTLRITRYNFRFESNKMGFINRRLGIREKIDNEGFPLWRKCREGDEQALKTMLEYNEGDVMALEQLYYRFRPYIRNFNVALYNEIDKPQCPVCGNLELNDEGYYYTPAGKWVSYRCTNCKCPSRGKENLLSKTKKKSLLVNS